MKLFLSYWILLCPLLAFSQQSFDYTISKPYKVIDAYSKMYFSNPKTGKVISIKIDGRNVYMQLFDAVAMQEVKRDKIIKLERGQYVSEVVQIQDKIYLFYTTWNKKQKIKRLFAHEVDVNNCQFKGAAKQLIELNEAAYFSYLYAHNKDKILIKCRKKPEKKRDAINHEKVGLYVFDKDLTLLNHDDVKMPYTEKQMDNIDYHVNKDGNPYILAKVRLDDSNKDFIGKGKNKKINYRLEVIRIDIKNKNLKITPIKLDKYNIEEIYLYEGIDNTILCSGFYNKKENKTGNADGIFLFKMEQDGGLSDKKFYEIPLEILNQYERLATQKKNNKKEQKDKAEFFSLVLRKLIVQEDNSIILVGEQYFVITSTYTDANGSTQTRYSYHYYDVLMTKIDAKGDLVWMRKLPKRQRGSRSPGGMGFKYMAIDGKHYVVYLDNIKNKDLKLDQSPTMHRDGKGGFLTAYAIDNETGKVSKVSIFDTLDLKGYKAYQFSTNRILPVSKDEFIIEFYKKKKEDLMVKVKIK